MLRDSFFKWHWDLSLQPAVEYLSGLFSAAPELCALELDEINGPLSEYTALVCRHFDVSPAWIVVSLQREQSLLTTTYPTPEKRLKALKAATGFVGQDVGRVALPGYYGIRAQIFRCAEQTAWNMGSLPGETWREFLRTRKTVQRYRPGAALEVEGVPADIICKKRTQRDGAEWCVYSPLTAGEYVQFSYTPHWHVLKANEDIAKKFAGQFL